MLSIPTDDYSEQAVDGALRRWQLDPAKGLTDAVVEARRREYGYKEIAEKEEPLWHRLFRRFWGANTLDSSAL